MGPDTKKEISYPHSFDDIVLLVPNIMVEKSNIVAILLDSPLLNVWSIVIALVTIVRIFFTELTRHKIDDWTHILLHTYGLSFMVSSSIQITNRSENVLLLFLGVFAILSNILCSGFLFQQYTSDLQTPAINTLEDLNKTNLDIYVSDMLYDNSDSNLRWLKKQ